jgi:isopentenyl phosphate kinase
MELIVIKIGGSVITQKESNTPSVDFQNLEAVARQLCDLKVAGSPKYILIHGVGSFGHPIVKQSGIDKGIKNPSQLLAFAQTQRLQNQLNCVVVGHLHKKGINAMPCQLSDHAVMSGGRIKSLELKAITGMLEIGLVPTCFGVPAYDEAQGCSILSGDQIAPYLAQKMGAIRIIEACDVEGVCDKNPKVHSDAKLIAEIGAADWNEVKGSLSGSLAIDVTGGMRQKYLELAEAAKNGIPSQIVHFLKLSEAIAGKRTGTQILVNG